MSKELRHHGLAFLGLLLGIILLLCMGLYLPLKTQAYEPVAVPVGIVVFGAPYYGGFVSRRLFALEHDNKTFSWLAALPLGLTAIGLCKWAIGALLVAAVPTALLLISKWVLVTHAWLPWPFVARLAGQACLYSWIWYGIGLLLAQVGRFRAVGTIFVLILWLQTLTWPGYQGHLFGASVLSLTGWASARFHFPWVGAGVAFATFAFLSALALALLRWKGGTVVANLSRPPTRRESNLQVVIIVLALLVPAPREEAEVYKAGVTETAVQTPPQAPPRLLSQAKALESSLQALGQQVGVRAWPRLVLVNMLSKTSPRVAELTRKRGVVFVEISPNANEVDVLYAVLPRLPEMMWTITPPVVAEVGWILAAYPAWWLEAHGHPPPSWLTARAERAKSHPVSLTRWDRALHALGRDVAVGHAWRSRGSDSNCALEEVTQFLKALLPELPVNQGYRKLAYELRRPPTLPDGCRLSPSISSTPGHAALGRPHRVPLQTGLSELRVQFLASPPPGLELWTVGYDSTFETARLPEPAFRHSVTRARASIPLPHDRSARVMVTSALAAPKLRGYIIGGWKGLDK